MRDSTFLLSLVFGTIALAGCDSSSNNNNNGGGDMSMHIVANHDLSIQPNGCNGLDRCIVQCNSTGGGAPCYQTCEDNATANALTLLNDFLNCIEMQCFQMNDADSGMPYCTCVDANNQPVSCTASGATPVQSADCSACDGRATSMGGACFDAATMCANDTP